MNNLNCEYETGLADIGGGKSFCERIGKWTNCREVLHCVADDLLDELESPGEFEAVADYER